MKGEKEILCKTCDHKKDMKFGWSKFFCKTKEKVKMKLETECEYYEPSENNKPEEVEEDV